MKKIKDSLKTYFTATKRDVVLNKEQTQIKEADK